MRFCSKGLGRPVTLAHLRVSSCRAIRVHMVTTRPPYLQHTPGAWLMKSRRHPRTSSTFISQGLPKDALSSRSSDALRRRKSLCVAYPSFCPPEVIPLLAFGLPSSWTQAAIARFFATSAATASLHRSDRDRPLGLQRDAGAPRSPRADPIERYPRPEGTRACAHPRSRLTRLQSPGLVILRPMSNRLESSVSHLREREEHQPRWRLCLRVRVSPEGAPDRTS